MGGQYATAMIWLKESANASLKCNIAFGDGGNIQRFPTWVCGRLMGRTVGILRISSTVGIVVDRTAKEYAVCNSVMILKMVVRFIRWRF